MHDPARVRHTGRAILKIAWIRNWTDRWAAKPWFRNYDLALCSSDKAAAWVSQATGLETGVLRIGSNTARFNGSVKSDSQLSSDYCFTGSYWGAPRMIERLDPDSMPYRFALFGRGWEGHKAFDAVRRGYLPYERLPGVYAGTRLLIDDANHATRPWASVNSRVFDALACGALVITNGVEGARETFGDAVPTYRSIAELEEKIRYFMEHEEERVEDLCAKLLAQLQQRRQLMHVVRRHRGVDLEVDARVPDVLDAA